MQTQAWGKLRFLQRKKDNEAESKKAYWARIGHTRSVAPSATEHAGCLYPQSVGVHMLPKFTLPKFLVRVDFFLSACLFYTNFPKS